MLDHLWLHFARHGPDITPPVITRGEGVTIFDDTRQELPRRAVRACSWCRSVMAAPSWRKPPPGRPSTLAYFPLWGYATPPAIELADRIAGYAPGELNRVFFTSGGGEAVESAWKLAKQYFKLTGKPGKYKVISRAIAYHGTTQGALAITGLPAYKTPFEPLTPGGFRVPNANFYRAPELLRHRRQSLRAVGRRPHRRGDRIRRTRHRRRGVPRTGAERGRLHPAAAGLLRTGAGDLRSLRRAVGVRRGDLRLRPDRVDVRLLRLRLPARHHHLRQGFDVGILADRRDDRQRPAVRAVQRRHDDVPARLHLRRPSGVGRRRAGQPRHLRARGSQRQRQAPGPGIARHPGEALRPADRRRRPRRGLLLSASNWSRTRRPEKPSPDEESAKLLPHIASSLFEAGLYCRTDDRGDPAISSHRR